MFKLGIGTAILFFVVTMTLAFRSDLNETNAAKNWCAPRGYQNFNVHGHKFCVDPKTRIVYLPEV